MLYDYHMALANMPHHAALVDTFYRYSTFVAWPQFRAIFEQYEMKVPAHLQTAQEAAYREKERQRKARRLS
jgi:hypothetical protein